MKPNNRALQKTAPAVTGSDLAPIIYFDGVVACGLYNGVVQLEVAANHLIPIEGATQPRTRIGITGHLRFSPAAAEQVIDMIVRALEFGKRPPVQSSPPPAPAPQPDKKALS